MKNNEKNGAVVTKRADIVTKRAVCCDKRGDGL